MGMIKIAIITAAMVGFLLLTPWGKQLTGTALAAVDPVSYQTKAFSQAKQSLGSLAKLVNSDLGTTLPADKLQEINSLVASASQSVSDAQVASQAADLPATISNILQAVGPKASPSAPTCRPN